jgi:hypothetical protein
MTGLSGLGGLGMMFNGARDCLLTKKLKEERLLSKEIGRQPKPVGKLSRGL